MKQKEKPKIGTPIGTSKYIPSTYYSASKLAKHNPNEGLLGPKSLSSVKSSQAEYRERELHRKKEAQKREALMQAQIEEKRKKREEKQLKAQQQREALEKEKLKQLELTEKLREEKLRQARAERDSKLTKQKEEMERKRQLAKKKAMEEKLREERKKAELKSKENAGLPPYMLSKAPLLPTADCYDSDQERQNELEFPSWCDGKSINHMYRLSHFRNLHRKTFLVHFVNDVVLKLCT